MSSTKNITAWAGLGIWLVGGCGLQLPEPGGDRAVVAVVADEASPRTTEPEKESVASVSEPEIVPALPLPKPAPEIFGTWVLDEGSLLATAVGFTEVSAMILRKDGVGRVFLEDRLTGARDCSRIYNLYDGQTLALDLSAEPAQDFNPDRFFVFPVVAVGEQSLGIADATGQIAWFSRRNALPDEATCGELEVQRRFNGLPAPHFFSDLVLFDGDLVYNSIDNLIERFDLNTNGIGAPLGSTSSRLVQTTQNDHLWTHCGCGGSRDAFRRDLNNVFDTVSTEDELGGPATIRAIAYDSVEDLLWLHARPFDNGFASLVVVDTSGEPDVKVEQFSFNRDVPRLAFDGTDMWALATIASPTIVRISTIDGRVVESYEVPDEDVSWSGLVFGPFNMYMLGTDLAGEGVILKIRQP